eukprot:TRINITY_DN74_c1_g1_i1.p1 TRINITY_DN74_c1_g1~~TRINITY_DN74_c1_g1_i1.p1  ORF type:complete len:510 (+),score=64.40 TRINITY_DN74_c1_g1_i1:93-1532(+)
MAGVGKTKAGDFTVIRLLGKGDVGKVYLVRHKRDKGYYAMKVIKKEEILRRKKFHRLATEWEVLCGSDHPFVARLLWCFQSRTKVYFVMEYCAGGEFFRFLQKQKGSKLDENAAKFYAAEVLLALEYLHLNGFVYRDVKPENILMNSKGHIVITDFDLSKKTSAEPQIVITKIKDPQGAKVPATQVTTPPTNEGFSSFVGTAEYIAPEVINDAGHNYAVDWWGFGILLYEMLFGTTPFKGTSQSDTFKKIAQNVPVSFPSRPAVSDACKALIKGLLNPVPKQRLGSTHGATEIKSHKWFKGINFTLIRNEEPPLLPIVSDPALIRSCDDLDDVMSDTDPEGFTSLESAQELLKSYRRTNLHDPAKKTSPYNHPAHVEVDPFRSLHYFARNDIEKCKYGLPTTPDTPTQGCTGFGSGSLLPPPPQVNLPKPMHESVHTISPPTPTLTHRITEKIKYALFRTGSSDSLRSPPPAAQQVYDV